MGEVRGGKGEVGNTKMSKEVELSIAASSMFPGFRFSPTDEELILYYLQKKLEGFDKCVEVIPEVDICKYEPWDLPAKAIIRSDQEWFFFSPRGKKYPNGSQSKRATGIGYWKATGKERSVKSGLNVIGTKRTLVFHVGRAPKGERTEWIMHEYCMIGKGQDALVVCRLRRKSDNHAVDAPNGHIAMPNLSTMKSASSHDSHSVEQTDSASQTNWKVKDEIMQPESSTRANYQRVNDEDDLFAEILNDNIVHLDECPPTSTTIGTPIVATTTATMVSVAPHVDPQQGHPAIARSYSAQGTANRRIRLRKLRRVSPRKEDLEEHTGENVVTTRPRTRRFWRATILRGPMRLSVTGNRLYVVVIMTGWFVIMTGWLLLFVSYAANPDLTTRRHHLLI